MVSLQQGEYRLLLDPTLRKGTLEQEQEERRRGSRRSIGLQEPEVGKRSILLYLARSTGGVLNSFNDDSMCQVCRPFLWQNIQ